MSEILFKSPCPAASCNDTTVYTWYHSKCSSSSDEYLNSDAQIRCTECGKKWDFFNTKFECATSNNEMKKSSLKRAINCFTALMMSNSLSEDFHFKICKSLKEQAAIYGLS
jgi:DNA-directed RNA polymerase subunit RPC12/RpoP